MKDEADLVFKFINAKELSEEELAEALAAGKTGNVLIFEKLKASGFDEEMLPAAAASAVQEQTKFRFSISDFTKMRHRDGIGPQKGQSASAIADGTNCIYSKAHKNHVYTQAYIVSLIQELTDPEKHEKALGRSPESIHPNASN